ncbi:MAG: histidinol-phosphatase HisJ family protein [Ruminococcaceae bacterium]|nr:histidinol-phosphatase HisJ family protein [Oscillospiraceae bacterium]
MIPADSHNHSTQSPDGKNTLREMAERACELGIEHYTITDHLEINKFYDPEFLYEEPVKQSSLLLPSLIEEYKGRLDIHYGVELGQPVHDYALTQRMLDSYDYEFIIGSCHMVKGWDDFYFLDYKKVDPHYVLNLYFEELLEMAEWGKFDVLGHLTYPLRYIAGDFGIKIDMSRYEAIIEKIFKTLIQKGMGIEINTSGLRQKIGVTLPDEHYISLYKKLGGEILTIGSDAHCTADLGKGIAEGISLAKKCGFDKIYYYDHRKPTPIKI